MDKIIDYLKDYYSPGGAIIGDAEMVKDDLQSLYQKFGKSGS